MSDIDIIVNQERWELSRDESFTFGRDETCTAVIDPGDLGISRVAGAVESHSDVWWLVNHSGSRSLQVVDEMGIRSVLTPGKWTAIAGTMTVIVEGELRRHALTISPTCITPPQVTYMRPEDSRPTSPVDERLINKDDRLALVALFAGYLQPFPRYDPHPRSYSDAAAALNCPRTTVVKRMERVRRRLTDAGVPNLLGENAMEALAEWALTMRVINKEDLELLN